MVAGRLDWGNITVKERPVIGTFGIFLELPLGNCDKTPSSNLVFCHSLVFETELIGYWRDKINTVIFACL